MTVLRVDNVRVEETESNDYTFISIIGCANSVCNVRIIIIAIVLVHIWR